MSSLDPTHHCSETSGPVLRSSSVSVEVPSSSRSSVPPASASVSRPRRLSLLVAVSAVHGPIGHRLERKLLDLLPARCAVQVEMPHIHHLSLLKRHSFSFGTGSRSAATGCRRPPAYKATPYIEATKKGRDEELGALRQQLTRTQPTSASVIRLRRSNPPSRAGGSISWRLHPPGAQNSVGRRRDASQMARIGRASVSIRLFPRSTTGRIRTCSASRGVVRSTPCLSRDRPSRTPSADAARAARARIRR